MESRIKMLREKRGLIQELLAVEIGGNTANAQQI